MTIKYLDAKRIRGSSTGGDTSAPTASTVSSDKVLSFTGNGTFTPTSNMTVRYLAIGGGGGGGNANGGGGGAGAFRTVTSESLTGGTEYTITIGIGGIGAIAENAEPTAAGDTTISGSGLTTITSSAGGYGGYNDWDATNHGGNSVNGSGGGAGHSGGNPNGGTSGAYGNDGGDSDDAHGAGGGGAGTAGTDSSSGNGHGGTGLQSDITGSNVYYSAGGGGAAQSGGTAGNGGTSGGGAGAGTSAGNGGTATTYGSGGGGGVGQAYKGGDGKQGIVILRFASSGAYSSSMGTQDDKATLITTYADGLGSDADATLNGATANSATAIYGKASLGFDGSNDTVNLGNDLDAIVSGAFTFSCWAYTVDADSGSNNRTVISKPANSDWSSPYNSFLIQQYGTNFNFSSNDTSGNVSISNAVGSAGWKHLVVTKTSGNLFSFYVNNDTPATVTHSSTWGTQDWTVGNTVPADGNRHWNGKIQDMAFWSRVLTSAERTILFGGGDPYDSSGATASDNTGKVATEISTTGLKAYYTFNDTTTGVTNSATDYSDLPENTLFEETDTYKTYWLQDSIWKDQTYPYIINPTTYASTSGWSLPSDRTSESATLTSVDTTNNGVTFNLTTSTTDEGGLVRDLGENLGSQWACKFKVEIDDIHGNDFYFLNFTTGDMQPFSSSNESINIQVQGASYWRFAFNRADNGSQTEDTASNSTASEDTTYYCTVIRDGNNVSWIIRTGSYSGSIVDTLVLDISGFSGNIRYLQHTTRGNNSSEYLLGWVRDLHIQNGVTTI